MLIRSVQIELRSNSSVNIAEEHDVNSEYGTGFWYAPNEIKKYV